MANEEHLALLKQGAKQWNDWRERNSEIQPDLRGAGLTSIDLHGINLNSADLSGATLIGARLSGANLRDARLSGADLLRAKLSGANLRRAWLNGADLSGSNLSGVNLSEAVLSRAVLVGADLSNAKLNSAILVGADLSNAKLNSAILVGADLSGANLGSATLQKARIQSTIFASIDLREVRGLVEVYHIGSSHIDLHTIQLPQDGSALHFLRGCGVPDEWIDFHRATMMHPIQYHSCFISYASKDDILARRLHADLQAQGVCCWFAPHDMKIGDKIRSRIDEAIHLQDKLLLILSKDSVASDWVEHEVETALARECKEKRTILFPIRLDNAILEREYTGWAALVQNERQISDFTNWADPHAYNQAFERLLRDLKARKYV